MRGGGTRDSGPPGIFLGGRTGRGEVGDRAKPADGFEAGPAVVIGAFPKTDLEFVREDLTVTGDAAQPFATLSVDEMLFDEIPRVQRGLD